MSLDKDINILKRHSLFNILDDEALRLLAFSTDRFVVGQDRIIVKQGARLDAALILESGKYAIEGEIATPSNPSFTHNPVGGIVGENFLLNPKSTAEHSLRALERCVFLRIKYDGFWKVIKEYPHNAVVLRTMLRERVQQFSQDVHKIWH